MCVCLCVYILIVAKGLSQEFGITNFPTIPQFWFNETLTKTHFFFGYSFMDTMHLYKKELYSIYRSNCGGVFFLFF